MIYLLASDLKAGHPILTVCLHRGDLIQERPHVVRMSVVELNEWATAHGASDLNAMLGDGLELSVVYDEDSANDEELAEAIRCLAERMTKDDDE